jgi:hypothetical protein
LATYRVANDKQRHKDVDTKNVVKLIAIDTLHVTSNAAGMDPIHCIELVLGFYHSTTLLLMKVHAFVLRVDKKSQAMSEVCVV